MTLVWFFCMVALFQPNAVWTSPLPTKPVPLASKVTAFAAEAKAIGVAIAAMTVRPRMVLRMRDGAFRVGRGTRDRGWRCIVAQMGY